MRILSRFHDYYDGVQAAGADANLVFSREKVELLDGWSPGRERVNDIPALWAPVFELLPSRWWGHYDRNRVVTVHPQLVLLGGRTYPGIRHQVVDRLDPTRVIEPETICYTLDELARKVGQDYLDTKTWRTKKRGYSTQGEELEALFKLAGGRSLEAFCIDQALPLALVYATDRSREVVVNPRLTDLQFYRVLDAWSAYQELSMFVGGLAAPENKHLPQVDDRHRIEQHGFDEWSFRKLPSKSR